VWFSDLQGRGQGELRLQPSGFVAITPAGVLAPTDMLLRTVIAVDAEAKHVDRAGAVVQIDTATAWDILLGERRWSTLVYTWAKAAWVRANAWYDSLGFWWKAGLWPALVWSLIALSGVLLWVFVPHRLAQWAMPAVGRPELPPWKWLTGIITLYGFLGQTRRPLSSWLKRHETTIDAKHFGGHPLVKQRARYCDLGHEANITAFLEAVRTNKSALRWIAGWAAPAKAALAFEMARRSRERARKRVVPILVNEDWSGSISDYVASLLRVRNREPTRAMVEALGAAGKLLVIVDSLSERGSADAEASVAEAARRGAFLKMIVTSRKPLPEGGSWRDFSGIEVHPLTRNRLPAYIATYAPKDDVETILARLEPLLGDRPLSPLFARFAIEQTGSDHAPARTPLNLVIDYVEALREQRLDLNRDSMLRASTIAALESIREALSPREIDAEHLSGVFTTEADAVPFIKADAGESIVPAALVEKLEECGLIVRNPINRRLQFAYDPVAELLAAWRIVQKSNEPGIKSIIKRIRSAEGSGLAMALANAEAIQRQEPASPRLVG
jgi:NAD(P)-dependent dehydrogenase (short-subunit alcohol dehydrogenase family)